MTAPIVEAAKLLALNEKTLGESYQSILNLFSRTGGAPTDLVWEYNHRVAEQHALAKEFIAFWRHVGLEVIGPEDPTWLPRISVSNWATTVTPASDVTVIAGPAPTSGRGGELGQMVPGPLVQLGAKAIWFAGSYLVLKGVAAVAGSLLPFQAQIERYKAQALSAQLASRNFKLLADRVTQLTTQCAGSDPTRFAKCLENVTAQMATIRDSLPNTRAGFDSDWIKTLGWIALFAALGYGGYRGYKYYRERKPVVVVRRRELSPA